MARPAADMSLPAPLGWCCTRSTPPPRARQDQHRPSSPSRKPLCIVSLPRFAVWSQTRAARPARASSDDVEQIEQDDHGNRDPHCPQQKNAAHYPAPPCFWPCRAFGVPAPRPAPAGRVLPAAAGPAGRRACPPPAVFRPRRRCAAIRPPGFNRFRRRGLGDEIARPWRVISPALSAIILKLAPASWACFLTPRNYECREREQSRHLRLVPCAHGKMCLLREPRQLEIARSDDEHGEANTGHAATTRAKAFLRDRSQCPRPPTPAAPHRRQQQPDQNINTQHDEHGTRPWRKKRLQVALYKRGRRPPFLFPFCAPAA